eukprot:CAMPEP_0196577818 /NCGR_PEP_ID=MMETSP1081-20130531/6826_1 /TAXON_ID=36882 /ORGANISM="Pyramimonas amylifera, Strain CCMP720" /LENGTH=272 /DNA_ID=CAMNT_0041896845 /DNA_START=258 /DNA_END=1073 /DNA_ORIENTATION=+
MRLATANIHIAQRYSNRKCDKFKLSCNKKCFFNNKNVSLSCSKKKPERWLQAGVAGRSFIPDLGLTGNSQIKYSSLKQEFDWDLLKSWDFSEVERRDYEAFRHLIKDPTTLVSCAYVLEENLDRAPEPAPSLNSSEGIKQAWWMRKTVRSAGGRKEIWRKKLVGYSWAKTDNSFVATVHALYVHPDHRDRGLGKKLMKRITKALVKRGVVDIGLLATPESSTFFRKCSFEEDRDGAVTLTFNPLASDSFKKNFNAKYLLNTKNLEAQLDRKW